ncbi:MAG: DUF5009 domain-containing protein [Saprospiraceae bacterium]|nr:DUF5009 domain-containing protein [Saprospiraceae bacterium]
MKRILSIDIFRGLTIFMMVFVNDLAGVSDIPAWMKHVAADADGMTFVDVVFPAFLFIVGMAIPFAVQGRLSSSDTWGFWRHVVQRTLGLLILGVYMVNSGEMNLEANLIPKWIWAPSLYVAAVLIWNNYPQKESGGTTNKAKILQAVGGLILIVLYFLYRKGEAGNLSGMTPSWWGILGLIGWAYLISILVYIGSGKGKWGVLGGFVGLSLIYIGIRTQVPFLAESWLGGQSGHLAHALIVLSGIFCSTLMNNGQEAKSHQNKVLHMLLWGLGLLLLGYLTDPIEGISKIRATPSWTYYCAGICSILYPFIYWLVDVKGKSKWASFLQAAGKNPLLTYIIPPFIYGILGFSFLPAFMNSGWLGFLKAIAFSLLVLAIARWFTEKRILLKL